MRKKYKIILCIVILILVIGLIKIVIEYNKVNEKENGTENETENKTTETIENISDIDSFYGNAITKDYEDIRKLDNDYTLEQAQEDNCFVISHTKVYNDYLYENFMNNYNNSFIRVVQPTVEGDIIIFDILYDSNNNEIILIIDNTRDKYSSSEDRTIMLSKYEKTCEYKYNNLYWVLYNGNINDELFKTDNVYIVTTIN